MTDFDARRLPTGKGVVILALAGDVDLTSAPKLREEFEQILEGDTGRIVIDATDISLLDSTGLSVLISAHQALERRGGGLLIRNPPVLVKKVLDVTGVSQRIPTDVNGAARN